MKKMLQKSFLKDEVKKDWSGKWCNCWFKQPRYEIAYKKTEEYDLGTYVFLGVERPKHLAFFCDKCGGRILADVTNKYFSQEFLELKFGCKVSKAPYTYKKAL